PQSDQAGDRVAVSLSDAGAIVTSVVAYRTCVPESLDGNALDRIQREGADIIFFASPSAFRNFAHTIGEDEMKQLAKHCAFGAIGPTTARAIRDAGVPVGFESPQPSTNAILKAMEDFVAAQGRAKIPQ
ncbi:MAG: uroporphyrinogen-III synthase, partial [Terracidiphilus sp.]